MPALQPPARILVTGATGYIAVWLVRSLLETGFSVRGTARSRSKASFLERLFAEEAENGRLEVVIVEDIEKPDAFDEAVKGVDGIAHTASPFYLNVDDPDELIKPAVQGTVGVLESARKYSKDCRRITILSSTAAVMQVGAGRLLNESDWNEQDILDIKDKGKDVPNVTKYRASKTLAEKAAWEYYSKHKEEVSWDIVSLNPPFVFGPIAQEVASPSSLNTSVKDFFDVLCTPNAGGKSDQALVAAGASRVDVRDIANAHTKAFLTEKAGGERIIISAGTFTWQEFLDVAHELFPGSEKRIHIGRPGAGKDISHPVRYDSSKSQKLLGLEYRSVEDTVRDSLQEFEKRGWFNLE